MFRDLFYVAISIQMMWALVSEISICAGIYRTVFNLHFDMLSLGDLWGISKGFMSSYMQGLRKCKFFLLKFHTYLTDILERFVCHTVVKF